MPEAMVTLRDLCQVTLPAEVVAAVGPETNGSLEVRVVAGSIVLTPTGTAAALDGALPGCGARCLWRDGRRSG